MNKQIERKFFHTKKRLLDRYEIEISKEDYIQLCNIIEKNGMKFDDSDKNKTTYLITYKNKDIAFGYNSHNKTINTALYKNKKQRKYFKIWKELFKEFDY
jgi:hypothetical protein